MEMKCTDDAAIVADILTTLFNRRRPGNGHVHYYEIRKDEFIVVSWRSTKDMAQHSSGHHCNM
jgi:hypothetical protein